MYLYPQWKRSVTEKSLSILPTSRLGVRQHLLVQLDWMNQEKMSSKCRRLQLAEAWCMAPVEVSGLRPTIVAPSGEATKTKAWLGAAAAVANSNARSEIKLRIEQPGDAAKQQISMPSTWPWLLTAQKDQSTSSAAGEEARGGMYLQYRNGCWLQ
jgi:hypothetical protein